MVLLDGDVVCYKAAFATEYSTYHVDDLVFRHMKSADQFIEWNFEESDRPTRQKVTVVEPKENTEFAVKAIIDGVIRNTGDSNIKVFISGEGNFRKDIPYPVKYKGGRPPKPSTYQAAYNYLADKYKAVKVNGIEVDDALAMHQRENTIIASIDKDLLTIPGAHYNMDSDPPRVFNISFIEAQKNFWKQMLTGDRVDNILGIYNLGPKTAEKLIKDCISPSAMEAVCRAEYVKHFGDKWEDMWNANMALLTIYKEPPHGVNYSFT